MTGTELIIGIGKPTGQRGLIDIAYGMPCLLNGGEFGVMAYGYRSKNNPPKCPPISIRSDRPHSNHQKRQQHS